MGFIRIGGYPMDLALTEAHSFPGESTNFPVEVGADMSDHIRELPNEITLECIVSNTPVGAIASDPSRSPGQGPDGTVPLPAADALARLRELKATLKPVTVETSLGAFAEMAFIDLDVPADKGKSPDNALFFTAKFKRVLFATNRRTKTRVRTAMPTGRSTGKVVVGKAFEIDNAVLWQHGNPPGAPWTPGNKVETVTVTYAKRTGQTKDQRIINMRGVDPGSPAITYNYAEGPLLGEEVVGLPRVDLVADLRRDKRLRARLPQTGATGRIPVRTSDGTKRVPIAAGGDRNLPNGVSTSSWSLVSPGVF